MSKMNRRDFVKHLALLAAGAAALPQQIAAFEKYYDINTLGSADLAAFDEIMVCGLANRSLPVEINLWVAGEIRLPLACNLFGGIIRWLAAPDQKIVAPGHQMKWQIKATSSEITNDWLKDQFNGHISCIGQDGVRRNIPLLRCTGNLA